MTTPKTKMEKEIKDPKNTSRRGSGQEEVNMKDIWKELQKLTEKIVENQEENKKELKTIRENQIKQQAQLELIRKEFKEDITTIKNDISKAFVEINDNKLENKKLGTEQRKLQKNLDDLAAKNEKMTKELERIQHGELEYALRLRNLQEDPQENLRAKTTKILATVMGLPEESMETEIDRTYRVQSTYAKQNKLIRDVLVRFTRKHTRDQVLRKSNQNPITHEGKKNHCSQRNSQTDIGQA
ncbi:calcium-binding and coiled-coil domain-containing protein 2-like [Anolis sagrei]|uniref:calcium-binding and coiled-coil domain-containing protein 2-like n=1 Tax=Anolis sagrei TaxID=38937 RepID=UPI0035224D86